MSCVLARSVGAAGVVAGVAAVLLSLVLLFGHADDLGLTPRLQTPALGLLISVSVTLLGVACLNLVTERARERSVRAANEAFSLGVTYGRLRYRPADTSVSVDEAA